MKKWLLLVLVLFMTGCSMVRIDTTDIDNIVSVILSKENTLYNQIGKGYKYYIPRGVSYVDTNSYNDVLYAGGKKYYLYIDAISYYYQKEQAYEVNQHAYYSKALDIRGKKGYIEINEQANGKYFIEFMYNYAKMEAIVSKSQIHETILDASYMLSTVQFNDNVIALMLDDEFLSSEEKYDIFTSKQQTNDFLKLEEVE